MGNSKSVSQRCERAEKTGTLSLSRHKLKKVPDKVLALSRLHTLDLSENSGLKKLPDALGAAMSGRLRTLNLSACAFRPALPPIVGALVALETLDISHNRRLADISIAKQRNGPIGDFILTFVGRYTKFENWVPDTYGEHAFPEDNN